MPQSFTIRRNCPTSFYADRMFKHLDLQQTNKVKDAMFLVEHEPDDVVIREGMGGVQCS